MPESPKLEFVGIPNKFVLLSTVILAEINGKVLHRPPI